MAAAAPTLKKVFLELGGKSAAIVLDDADLAAAVGHDGVQPSASTPARAARSPPGCSSRGSGTTRRCRSPPPRWSRSAPSDPADPGHDLRPGDLAGPARPGRGLPAARRGGGRRRSPPAAASIESRADGFWIEPTVIAGLDNTARLAQEEIFGPVLVVIPHDGDDDAVRIANDSAYGLSGSVDSGDLGAGQGGRRTGSAPAPSRSTAACGSAPTRRSAATSSPASAGRWAWPASRSTSRPSSSPSRLTYRGETCVPGQGRRRHRRGAGHRRGLRPGARRRGRGGRGRRPQRGGRRAGRQGDRGGRRHARSSCAPTSRRGVGGGAGRRAPSAAYGGIDLLVNNAAIYGDMQFDLLITRRLGLLPEVHVGEHGRRAGDDPRRLPAHAGARRRRDRQPELDGGVPLLRLLRPGQGRRQRPHPAARPRARRHEHPGQRDRARARPTPRPPAPRPATRPRSMVKGLAIKRMGQPEDMVGACLFLLSDEAAWVTGQILAVDGGQIVPVVTSTRSGSSASATSASRWRCGWPRPTASSSRSTTCCPIRSPSSWRPEPRPPRASASSPRADVVCVMVRDDDQVRAGGLGDVGARPGARRHPLDRRARHAGRARGRSGLDRRSTHRSAGARWAPPTARSRSWSAAATRRSRPPGRRSRRWAPRSCTPARSAPARG